MKKIVSLLLVALFVFGTSFRAKFKSMYYEGGSGPQIVATYYGDYIIANGSGIIRIDYNAGGYLYNGIVTPGSPYYIPSNTTTLYLSNQASMSMYDIY